MMNKKNLIRIISILTGAIAGYAYWYYIGCASGTCPITAHWHTNMIYGAIMGYLLGDLVLDLYTKVKQKKESS